MTVEPVAGWDALVDRLATLRSFVSDVRGGNADATVAPDPRVEAEGVRYLLRFLAAGIDVCVEHDDPVAPALTHAIEDRRSWGLDNPDCLYTYSRVAGDGVYLLHGRRGSATHLEVQVNTGHYADGDFTGWRAVAAVTGDDLVCEADGTFELVLGGDAATAAALLGHAPGNHRPLTPDASFLLVRQYFGDWLDEVPADLALDRLDTPMPAAPLTADRLGTHLELLLEWLDTGLRCWADLSAGFRSGAAEGGGTPDITPFLPPAEAAGLKGQAYGMGGFHCAPDQAVIIELAPPACRLWSISLCDRWWQSIDLGDRQSSLNAHQAAVGADGRVVAVLCHDDPGLANWLDPGSETEGTIAVRYLFAPGQAAPGELPTVRCRTVACADLEAALPAGAATVTAEGRQVALRARRLGLARRYRR